MEIKVKRIHKLDDVDLKLKGFADIVIDDELIISGFRIVQGKDRMYVGVPQELLKNGRWHDRVHVIKPETMKHINYIVLSAFDNLEQIGGKK